MLASSGAASVSMMVPDPLAALRDEALPGLPSLVSAGPPAPLCAAVEAAGGVLISALPCQISYQPGRTVTVRYDARVAWSGQGAARETLVAATGGSLPSGALVVGNGDASVAVWRLPHDPALPGLASALDRQIVGALLDDLGLARGAVELRLRSYRPLRRAVVEAVTSGSRLFLKVVPPARAEALHRRHVALSARVPTPRSHGWSATLGVVALQALPGRTMRRALQKQGVALPGPQAFLGLLRRLPSVNGAAVRAPSSSAARHGRLVAAVVPELAARISRLVAAVECVAVDDGDEVPLHGDLHDAQLLVDGGRITGLLDVDTAGAGHRTTDVATLVGHLSTVALSSSRRPFVEGYTAELLAGFDVMVDPARLRREVAAVVLGLATGPFRVQQQGWVAETQRRLALAEWWLAGATTKREFSPAPHHPLTGAGHDRP